MRGAKTTKRVERQLRISELQSTDLKCGVWAGRLLVLWGERRPSHQQLPQTSPTRAGDELAVGDLVEGVSVSMANPRGCLCEANVVDT